MRKKYKIERALLKLYGDSPEGNVLRNKILERQYKKERIRHQMSEFFDFLKFLTCWIIIIACILTALVCPLVYYTGGYGEITVCNVSAEDYAYILRGNETMHILYAYEERNLVNNSITFSMSVVETWHPSEVAKKFFDIGNISYEEK